MANGQHLELLFPNLRGGYVHSNPKAKTSLNHFLTGTTTAQFVMPGWEVGWLYLKGNHDRHYMHPIAVGVRTYQLIGPWHDIMGLLEQRAEQPVVASGVIMAMVDATGQYAPATPVPEMKKNEETGKMEATGKMKLVNTHVAPEKGSQVEMVEDLVYGPRAELRHRTGDMYLHVARAEAQKPPSTLAREAMLELGANFIGMGGETFGAMKTLFDFTEFLNETLSALGGGVHFPTGEKEILELTASAAHSDLKLPTTFSAIKKYLEKHNVRPT